MGPKMAKIHPGGPFQKGVFVEFSHFGSRQNTRWPSLKIEQRGTLTAFF
jgi:hypothetical protein